MNYKKIYESLVTRIPENIIGYTEVHHILPRCMGGNDDTSNLVSLTPEEHFLAHLLLVKIYPQNQSLIFAANMMCVGHEGKRTNKSYGWLKRSFSNACKISQKGCGNSQYGMIWISNPATSESKKISKHDTLPPEFVMGRNRKEKVCSGCNTIHYETTKWCKNCVTNKFKGNLNPQFGTMWITDGNINVKVKKDSVIPNGYSMGRVVKRRKLDIRESKQRREGQSLPRSTITAFAGLVHHIPLMESMYRPECCYDGPDLESI